MANAARAQHAAACHRLERHTHSTPQRCAGRPVDLAMILTRPGGDPNSAAPDLENGANGLHGSGNAWDGDRHTEEAANDDGLPRLALPHLQIGMLSRRASLSMAVL